MKSLKTPFIEELDSLKIDQIGEILELKARREYIDTINWSEYPYKPIVAFDIARSNSAIYLRYSVKGFSLKASYATDNSSVHKDSCVEFFCKRPTDKEDINFEFNCIGTCDAAHRVSRDEKRDLTPEEYASIRRYATAGTTPFEEKKGIYSWELIVAIPFSIMGIEKVSEGDILLGNFYKCADDTEHPHFVSWNPIDVPNPDFHRPEYFSEIVL